MAIEFHCDHCGMLVKTSDAHAGKRGKCPGCKQSVYIPTPDDDIETLDLAPIDDDLEEEKKRIRQETQKIAQRIDEDDGDIPDLAPEPDSLGVAGLELDMESLIVEYALSMAEGKLADAEKLSEQIHEDWDQAEDIIQRITADDIPPRRLKNIPHPVLVGFLRQLGK